jgi:hypothetical protein
MKHNLTTQNLKRIEEYRKAFQQNPNESYASIRKRIKGSSSFHQALIDLKIMVIGENGKYKYNEKIPPTLVMAETVTRIQREIHNNYKPKLIKRKHNYSNLKFTEKSYLWGLIKVRKYD